MGFTSPSRRRRAGSSLEGRILPTRGRYYSLFVILIVRLILFVFLWVLFATTVRIMRTSLRSIPQHWRYVLPGVIAGIAALIGYHIFLNGKEIARHAGGLRRKDR